MFNNTFPLGQCSHSAVHFKHNTSVLVFPLLLSPRRLSCACIMCSRCSSNLPKNIKAVYKDLMPYFCPVELKDVCAVVSCVSAD